MADFPYKDDNRVALESMSTPKTADDSDKNTNEVVSMPKASDLERLRRILKFAAPRVSAECRHHLFAQ